MSSDDDRRQRKMEEKEKRKRDKAIASTLATKSKLDEKKKAEMEEYVPAEIEAKGYEVLKEEVSSGAFWTTFKAKRKTENLFVKIYDLEQKDYKTNKDQQKNLHRQLIILHHLDSKHQNIIGYRDIFKAVKRIYIFMEFASNGSVQEYVRSNGAVDEAQGKAWLYDVLKALNYLHTNGIVHVSNNNNNFFIISLTLERSETVLKFKRDLNKIFSIFQKL